MDIIVSSPVKFENVHYLRGPLTVADDLALRMIVAGVATKAIADDQITALYGSVDSANNFEGIINPKTGELVPVGSGVDLTGSKAGNVVVVNSANNGLITTEIVSNLFNFNPDSYPKTRAILAGIEAGNRASQTNDVGAINLVTLFMRGGSLVTDPIIFQTRYFWSPAFMLSRVLNSLGIPSSSESWIGTHDLSDTPISDFDTRCAFSADWTRTPASGTQGLTLSGRAYVTTANTQGNITFTPSTASPFPANTDRLVVWYKDELSGTQDLPRAFGGTGSTAATVVTRPAYTNSGKILQAVFSSPTTTVWNVSKLTADTNKLEIYGMYAFNSTRAEVTILDCFQPQDLGVDLLATQSNGLIRLGTVLQGDANGLGGGTPTTLGKTHLAILSIGTREASAAGVSLNPSRTNTLFTQLTTAVASLKAAGVEVLLVLEPKSDLTFVNYPVIKTHMEAVALAQGVAMVNAYDRMPTKVIQETLGLRYNNGNSLTPSGSAALAYLISKFFTELSK